jgi:hypothetical protein
MIKTTLKELIAKFTGETVINDETTSTGEQPIVEQPVELAAIANDLAVSTTQLAEVTRDLNTAQTQLTEVLAEKAALKTLADGQLAELTQLREWKASQSIGLGTATDAGTTAPVFVSKIQIEANELYKKLYDK